MGFSKPALYYYSNAYSLDSTNVDTLWDRVIFVKEIGQMNIVRSVLPTAFCPEDLAFLQLPEAQRYVDFDKDLAEEAAEIMEAI